MHVISRKRIREFAESHPGVDEAALDRWYRLALRAEWRNFAQVRAEFPAVDQVGKQVVFDVGGNKYRIIARIYYEEQVVLLRRVLTHAEYDRGDWEE